MPSQRQLEKLSNKAKLATAGKKAEDQQWRKLGNLRGRRRRRLLIWTLEFLVLLAVIDIFILTPRRRERETLRRESRSRRELTAFEPEPLPALGTAGLELRQISEVSPAYAASLERLAAGSREARQRQIDYSRQMRLPIEVENSIGMRFRLVPPGHLLQGSPVGEAGRWPGERRHSAIVEQPLYVGRFEVTQEQWYQVIGTTPSYFQGDQRPVENITWDQAKEFTRELNRLEGLDRETYRLLTETEWEYACRAGTDSAYVFGDNPAQLGYFAAYQGNSRGRTNAVGRFLPNAFGLHDMHGNLWEWCENLFSNYPEVDLPDPTGGKWRNVRGGNWREQATDCRSATRTRLPPDSHGNILGLRVVRTIPELVTDRNPTEGAGMSSRRPAAH